MTDQNAAPRRLPRNLVDQLEDAEWPVEDGRPVRQPLRVSWIAIAVIVAAAVFAGVLLLSAEACSPTLPLGRC